MMIFDLGTATTVSVIDEKKNYIGGMIYPGVNISLNALTENASQLQGIGLEAPKRIVGKNTIECMKSGVLYSSAAAIDGIIDRIGSDWTADDCNRNRWTFQEDCSVLQERGHTG